MRQAAGRSSSLSHQFSTGTAMAAEVQKLGVVGAGQMVD